MFIRKYFRFYRKFSAHLRLKSLFTTDQVFKVLQKIVRISAVNPILDVWQGSDHVSVFCKFSFTFSKPKICNFQNFI